MAKKAVATSAFVEVPTTDAGIREFLASSYAFKPAELKIDELRWKSTIRAVVRGDNILFVGPSGCGKTMLAQMMAKIFNRPYFYFNMGATQDPRSTLIGNTHFKKDEGTYVATSLFIKAIQTPNALILLDELSRAHPEAHNILMTPLDARQRYVRVDEDPNTPKIDVAPGVCFMATANVGAEYHATRAMDHALLDRFAMIDMLPLGKEDELDLLTATFDDVDVKSLTAIADIAHHTREQVNAELPKIDTIVSTRVSMRMAAMIRDGMTLKDALEIEVYPHYSNTGEDSPRSYMKQLAQKYLVDPSAPKATTEVDPDNLNGDASRPWDN